MVSHKNNCVGDLIQEIVSDTQSAPKLGTPTCFDLSIIMRTIVFKMQGFSFEKNLLDFSHKMTFTIIEPYFGSLSPEQVLF
jgi:hypothetical protein